MSEKPISEKTEADLPVTDFMKAHGLSRLAAAAHMALACARQAKACAVGNDEAATCLAVSMLSEAVNGLVGAACLVERGNLDVSQFLMEGATKEAEAEMAKAHDAGMKIVRALL